MTRLGYQCNSAPGELLGLGIRLSATSIAPILRRAGLSPAPRSGPTWAQFPRSQAAGILACEFLTVETLLLKTYYVLFFIELRTRRVHIAGTTTNPDSAWVTQQARNVSGDLQELEVVPPERTGGRRRMTTCRPGDDQGDTPARSCSGKANLSARERRISLKDPPSDCPLADAPPACVVR
jgi:hypothetical protein